MVAAEYKFGFFYELYGLQNY